MYQQLSSSIRKKKEKKKNNPPLKCRRKTWEAGEAELEESHDFSYIGLPSV